MERDAGVGREEKRKLWEQRLQEWRSSGLSQSAYCRKAGVSIRSFGQWNKKLAGDSNRLSLVELPGHKLSSFNLSPQYNRFFWWREASIVGVERGFDADTLHEGCNQPVSPC